ncbi:hypothetical protein KKA95_02580, partial [Patescibacteria group bacterium]|nr:hypothetical protein [Patescibacteria group bacterium]
MDSKKSLLRVCRDRYNKEDPSIETDGQAFFLYIEEIWQSNGANIANFFRQNGITEEMDCNEISRMLDGILNNPRGCIGMDRTTIKSLLKFSGAIEAPKTPWKLMEILIKIRDFLPTIAIAKYWGHSYRESIEIALG